MRVLLSTIGSRGDVQPLVALALALRELQQDVRLCVPPDFREWIEGMGLSVTPIGPELRATGKAASGGAPLTPEKRRQMIEGTVATQFETIAAAAKGCDVIVGATALQIAAPSIAERMGIPYVFVAYCPVVLPSPHHPPPVLAALGQKPAPAMSDYSELWAEDARRWNTAWLEFLNAHRAKAGMTAVDDVRGHVHTNHPWLAADRTLAPWPTLDREDTAVFQPGAWILRDDRPLSSELQTFLDAGAPPIYFGFGSNRAPADLSRVMIDSARALGHRVVLSRGWAELTAVDDAADCFVIGEVNVQSLFKRVAAVVHHGGAGTTTAAALAGAPQVIIPQHYDQHYFAQRVEHLGIGASHAPGAPTVESLTGALHGALQSNVAARARAVSALVRDDGAGIGAQHLVALRS
jgi:vancomycin aglycone glucosyltransferase